MKTALTDKHERIREAHQAANAFGKDIYVMINSSDLGALLTERDALREALVAILEHDSPTNIVDTATATERDIFDIASAALAQGEV